MNSDCLCDYCGVDVKPTGLNSCPVCDSDLSQGIMSDCKCGEDGTNECEICGDFMCAKCHFKFVHVSNVDVRSESNLCRQCYENMESENE